jgi:hypothetical protein
MDEPVDEGGPAAEEDILASKGGKGDDPNSPWGPDLADGAPVDDAIPAGQIGHYHLLEGRHAPIRLTLSTKRNWGSVIASIQVLLVDEYENLQDVAIAMDDLPGETEDAVRDLDPRDGFVQLELTVPENREYIVKVSSLDHVLAKGWDRDALYELRYDILKPALCDSLSESGCYVPTSVAPGTGKSDGIATISKLLAQCWEVRDDSDSCQVLEVDPGVDFASLDRETIANAYLNGDLDSTLSEDELDALGDIWGEGALDVEDINWTEGHVIESGEAYLTCIGVESGGLTGSKLTVGECPTSEE